MRKHTLISLIALITAIISLLITLAAYFNRKKSVLCDDFEDDIFSGDDLDYYTSEIESCGESGGFADNQQNDEKSGK